MTIFETLRRSSAVRRRVRIAGAAAVAGAWFTSGLAESWRAARPDYEWSFPADHAVHSDYKTEWWYLTGHLQDERDPQRWFGFQFTFFRFGLVPVAARSRSQWSTSGMVMGHLAITDVAADRHHFSEVLYRETPLLAGFGSIGDSALVWSRAPAGTAGRWTLAWNGAAFDVVAHDDHAGIALELSTQPLKPLVLQGPNGFSRKGTAAGHASQYYSFSRLQATGSLRVGGRRYDVSGRAWMDKEFSSNQLSPQQVGWDWFSLQLDDGRDLMLYALRDTLGNVDYAGGTVVSATGTARYLDGDDWSATGDSEWTSPNGARYPTRWRVRVPSESLDLRLRAVVAGQENRGRSLAYWEGAAIVEDRSGRAIGRSYVEMTGYGVDNRPPL